MAHPESFAFFRLKFRSEFVRIYTTKLSWCHSDPQKSSQDFQWRPTIFPILGFVIRVIYQRKIFWQNQSRKVSNVENGKTSPWIEIIAWIFIGRNQQFACESTRISVIFDRLLALTSHPECVVASFERCKFGKLHKDAGKVIENAAACSQMDQNSRQHRNYCSTLSESPNAEHRRARFNSAPAKSQRLRSSFDRIIDSFHGCEWIRAFQHQAEIELHLPTGTSNHHSHSDDECSVHDWHHWRNLLDGQ